MAKDWDRIADEEEAKLDAADARVPTAPDASASAPRGRAEAEERSKRDALKAAKDVWRAKDDAMLAAKLVLADETGVDRVITQADLGDDKHAVHIKNAKDAAYVLDPLARVAKVFVEACERVTVRIQCVVISQHVEMWSCDGVVLRLDAPVATVQVDGCRDADVAYGDPSRLGAIVHATCDALRATFGEHQTKRGAGAVRTVDLVAAAREADARHPERDAAASGEVAQYITRRVAGEMLTERVVRGKDEYPTTLREMRAARAEAAASGDAAAAAAIAADAPLETDTKFDRAEVRKARGNEAFKEGNYAQAAVFYTQALELAPAHHVALANRSACFLKMGEHERALADARACVAAESTYVKGHFRVGLSLHAAGRFGEAVVALEKAERLDPKNKQVAEALRMAGFKARQHAAS